jgi:hypothetical protein
MGKSFTQSNRIKVALNNLDNITTNTLNFFFKSNLCDKAELCNLNSNFELVFVDYERGLDKEFISQLEINHQYAILLHMKNNTPVENKRLLLLEKPIKAKVLKENINSAFKIIRNQKPDTDKSNSDTQIDLLTNLESKINKVKTIEVKTTKSEVSETNTIKNGKIDKTNNSNSHLYLAINADKETQNQIQNRYKSHKYVGSNKDIDVNNPNELHRIYHTPKKYLYPHLSKAVKTAQANQSDVKITTLMGNLFYCFKENNLYFKVDSHKLKFMQTSPLFNETSLSIITIKQDLLNKNYSRINATKMIWESAIFASKGRLPNDTSLTKNIEMKCWPNFSKLMIFRNSIRIAATWSRNSTSILDTSSQLDLPQRYVFTLFTAMHALNCIKIGTIETKFDTIKNSKNKSLFSKILSHIFSK